VATTARKTKLGEPVTAYGFKGMNNLPEAPAVLLDRERQMTPQVVLNADVTDGGVIQAREGYVLTKALTNCHSVAGEESGLSVMLCVADGITWPQALYRVEGALATELCEVTGPRARVSYAEINNVVYASNPYWKATYDLQAGTVGTWGISLPPAPDIALTAGDLPPGTYSLCYTNVVGNRLGGNGPLVKIRWDGGQQGIQLKNLPAGAFCWITHPNGKELFLAPASGGVVSGQSPWLKPLPSFMVQPPPGFSHFIYAFGRIWGARGKQVFYSDPHQYEWFRPGNFLPFLEDVVLLAPATGGIFANSLKNTWYLDGTDPAKMESRRTGNGAVPGTLTMVQVPANIAGGAQVNELFGQLSKMPTPVWMSPTGFVCGTHGGNLTYLTENRLNLQPRTLGASLYRLINGIPQVISSLYGLSEGKDSLEEFFTRGQIYIPAPSNVVGSVEIAIS
jgi:hypothetical protein